MLTTVFVYGTLKVGQPNHNLLQEERRGLCRFVGKARTLEKYPLVIASKFNVPYLLYEPGTGHRVYGELYEVDDVQLEVLDELEKHPHVYERLDTKVEITDAMEDDNTGDVTVQAYFLVKYQPRLLELRMHESYADNTDGLMFDTPTCPVTEEENIRWWSEVHTEPDEVEKNTLCIREDK